MKETDSIAETNQDLAYAKWYIARRRRWLLLWFMPWGLLVTFYFLITGIEHNKAVSHFEQSKKALQAGMTTSNEANNNTLKELLTLAQKQAKWDLYRYCLKSKWPEKLLSSSKSFSPPYSFPKQPGFAINNSWPDSITFNWQLPNITSPNSPVMLYLKDNTSILEKAKAILGNHNITSDMIPASDSDVSSLYHLGDLLLLQGNYYYRLGKYSQASQCYLLTYKLGHFIATLKNISSIWVTNALNYKAWQALLFQLFNTPQANTAALDQLIDQLFAYPYFSNDFTATLDAEEQRLHVDYDRHTALGIPALDLDKRVKPPWCIRGITCNSSARKLLFADLQKGKQNSLNLLNCKFTELQTLKNKYDKEIETFYRFSPEHRFYRLLGSPISEIGSEARSAIVKYRHSIVMNKLYYLAGKSLIYYYRNGNWPEKQSDLGLKQELLDDFAQTKQPIKLQTDGDGNLKIWSVGFDGVDHSGKNLSLKAWHSKKDTDIDTGFALRRPNPTRSGK